MIKSYYETLELGRDAEPNQIKSAYRRMALKWHPDKNGDERQLALKKFYEVNEAYNILSKSHLKLQYDCKLEEAESFVHLFTHFNNDYLDDEEKDILNKFKQRMDETHVKKKIRKRNPQKPF